MRTTAIAVALIVAGVAITLAGLFGRFLLTDDEGHHDGREPTFALLAAAGADELVVSEVAPGELSVSIERAGQPIQSFDDVHGAPLHLFVVSTDLDRFRHVDLVITGGQFEPVAVGGGDHRIVVQVAPDGDLDLLELGTDVSTAGSQPPPDTAVATDDVFEVPGGPTVERQGFDFVLSEPWQREEFHGAPALLTMFRADDLAFVHAHAELPSDDRFRFSLDLPGRGQYLAALEFVHDGSVRTALFRVDV